MPDNASLVEKLLAELQRRINTARELLCPVCASKGRQSFLFAASLQSPAPALGLVDRQCRHCARVIAFVVVDARALGAAADD